MRKDHAEGRVWTALVVLSLSVLLAELAVASPPTHWAFQPVKSRPVPQVAAASAIDAFLLAKRDGRPFAPPAERRIWLRRAYYDVMGLPPSPEQLALFLADQSPQAYGRVLDRLLASPRYGERWGRHWMDVARYADTAGDNADYPVPEARLYRDYIIQAFNHDMPYDQFVREQLAGDILAKQGPRERYAEQVIATGFLALSRRYATAPFEFMHLTIEDTIETTGRAFLGMTFRCARCHDHKYDPVTREDYYAMYGFFESTRFPYAGSEEFVSKKTPRSGFQALVPAEESGPAMIAYEARLAALDDALKRLETKLAKAADKKGMEERKQALNKELTMLRRLGTPPTMPVAYAVEEGKAGDSRLQPRGEPTELGPAVPRRAPASLGCEPTLDVPAGASGRLPFAQWIASPNNPLTARVMVNRLWQHHFGRGLVTTPSNFGLRGEPPTHPELLDHLASRFVESAWSTKFMHRLLMDSDAYRQSAGDSTDYAAFARRRLSAEEIRDSMLLLAERLDLAWPGPHPFPKIADWPWTQHNPFKTAYDSNHRSVYLMTQRLQRHPYLALFDAPDANVSTDERTDSTVPLQALYVMNNPFVREQAAALAERVMAMTNDEAERIALTYRLAWSREPSAEELARTRHYLADCRQALGNAPEQGAWASHARIMITANEFFYLD